MKSKHGLQGVGSFGAFFSCSGSVRSCPMTGVPLALDLTASRGHATGAAGSVDTPAGPFLALAEETPISPDPIVRLRRRAGRVVLLCSLAPFGMGEKVNDIEPTGYVIDLANVSRRKQRRRSLPSATSFSKRLERRWRW